MRTLLTASIAAFALAGCAPSDDPSANAQSPAADAKASAPVAVTSAAQPPAPAKAESKAPPNPATTHAPAMSREEIAAYIRAVVSVELSKLDLPEGTPDDDPNAPADSGSNSATRNAVNAAIAAAEKRARDQTDEAARETSEQERLVAQYLLSPDELKRVDEIRNRLKDSTIWGLPYQDLEFAAAGLATPLLHDDLLAAAARTDDAIEVDVWANRAQLAPLEKIQFAQFPPEERERVLSFLDSAAKGLPADPEPRIREFVYRYPFMRKLLAAALLASKQNP